MMRVFLCFCFVFYLSRSPGLFAPTPSPILVPRLSHRIYGVNVYCSRLSLSYILNIIFIQTEYKENKRRRRGQCGWLGGGGGGGINV